MKRLVAMCFILASCSGGPPKPPDATEMKLIKACGALADSLPLPDTDDAVDASAAAQNAANACQAASLDSLGTTCEDYVGARLSYASVLSDALDDPKPSNKARAEQAYYAMEWITCPQSPTKAP